MEIIMKVLTFCGAAVFLTAAAAIITIISQNRDGL